MELKRVLFAARPTLTRADYGQALRRAGFGVTMTDSGVQTLGAFYAAIPGVLIIEPEIPWGGGDGVLDIVHEDCVVHHVAVVVLSTEQRRSSLYSISQFHVEDFIGGIVQPSQLVDRILRLEHHRDSRFVLKVNA